MKGETWPYRVRVRQYKHFRQTQQEGGKFDAGQEQSENSRNEHSNSHA